MAVRITYIHVLICLFDMIVISCGRPL